MRSYIREYSRTLYGIRDRLFKCFYARAHKAANPSKYPIKDETREMYPSLKGIEERYGPTAVHLQVYDGRSLPGIFSC
jgi:hypothetical protein